MSSYHVTSEQMDSEWFKNIFYSGFAASPVWQVLDELTVAIHNGAIQYFILYVTSVDDYHKIRESINYIEGLGPQGKGHMALKKIAQAWLKSQYGCDSIFESYFIGLHPDVCSRDNRFVVECGTTDPSCVSIYLDNENVQWVGNIPYPYAEETDIFLHAFRRGPKYISWHQEKVSKNRAVFEKYHRR